MDVVGDAVEQSAGDPLGAEDPGPLVEGRVAVTVTAQVPAQVPGLLLPPPPSPAPHASTLLVRATRNANIPSTVRQLRRRAGMPNNEIQRGSKHWNRLVQLVDREANYA